MKKLNKKGFTIVELVIVIAVIAILAAVLIPTFTTVIAKSRASAALQTAKNALENVVAETATDGGISNGTLFAVAEKKGAEAKHYIVYDASKDENLAAVKVKDANVPAPTATTYVVFANSKSANVIATLQSVIGGTVTFEDSKIYTDGETVPVEVAGETTTNYANGYYFKGSDGTNTIKLYAIEDLPETIVVILK